MTQSLFLLHIFAVQILRLSKQPFLTQVGRLYQYTSRSSNFGVLFVFFSLSIRLYFLHLQNENKSLMPNWNFERNTQTYIFTCEHKQFYTCIAFVVEKNQLNSMYAMHTATSKRKRTTGIKTTIKYMGK